MGQGDGKIGGGEMWILGDNFHEKFQVGYDYSNKKVGLPKDPVQPAPAPTPADPAVLEAKIDAANSKLDLIMQKLKINVTAEEPSLLIIGAEVHGAEADESRRGVRAPYGGG